MIRIIEDLNLLNEMTLTAALDSIVTQINDYLSTNKINHSTHNVTVIPDYANKCVKIQFNDTNMEYEVKPGIIDNSSNKSTVIPKSIRTNFPHATYNPHDYSFYNGSNKIGIAYVGLPVSKNIIDYSDDLTIADKRNHDKETTVHKLFKDIASDVIPGNRISHK